MSRDKSPQPVVSPDPRRWRWPMGDGRFDKLAGSAALLLTGLIAFGVYRLARFVVQSLQSG